MLRISSRIPVLVLCSLFAVSCSEPDDTAPDAAETPATPAPETVAIDGMRNVVRVGNITVGAQPSPEGLAQAAELGYTVVVSNRAAGEIDWDERAVLDSLGIEFISMPMPGPVNEITDAQVDQFDRVVSVPGANVLLHCASGNRASGLWATWLVEKQGVEPERALELAAMGGMGSVRSVVEARLGIGTPADH